MNICDVKVRQRFGSRKLENPLKTSDFGHSTADEAEQANVSKSYCTDNLMKIMTEII